MCKKELTCIVCPRGCRLTVTKENDTYTVSGNHCKRGIDYGVNEVINPVRILTSTVKIEGAIYNRLPVMTDQAISKSDMFQVMEEVKKVTVKAPVCIGDVIIAHLLGTEINLIASRSMDKI